MRILCPRTAVVVWLVASAAGNASGQVIYNQSNNGTFGFFADAAPGQFYSTRVADDFVLASSQTVVGVDWWGASENFEHDNLTNMTSFVLQVYADSGGLPGSTVLGPISLATGATNPSPSGRYVGGATEFAQSASVPPTLLPAGTYWISIGAVLAVPDGDAWAWSNSNDGNGSLAAQDPYGAPYALSAGQDFDLAFQIRVPEPGAAMLLAFTVLTLARRRAY